MSNQEHSFMSLCLTALWILRPVGRLLFQVVPTLRYIEDWINWMQVRYVTATCSRTRCKVNLLSCCCFWAYIEKQTRYEESYWIPNDVTLFNANASHWIYSTTIHYHTYSKHRACYCMLHPEEKHSTPHLSRICFDSLIITFVWSLSLPFLSLDHPIIHIFPLCVDESILALTLSSFRLIPHYSSAPAMKASIPADKTVSLLFTLSRCSAMRWLFVPTVCTSWKMQ